MMQSEPDTCPFDIPLTYQDQIRFRPSPDRRSDAEIIETLTKTRPVFEGHEKNIWAFWHAGAASMPAWCQRNVCNWVRLCGPGDWIVRVLDSVPESPNNALKFVPADMLPEACVKGTMTGEYIGPHSADFLRGASLYLYGGVFMDVGNILFRHLDRICWTQLEDPTNPYRVSIPLMYGLTTANHFVAARKGDPFIKRW